MRLKWNFNDEYSDSFVYVFIYDFYIIFNIEC